MVEQLAIVHLGEPFGLRRFHFRGLTPTVEDLVFVLFQVIRDIRGFSSHQLRAPRSRRAKMIDARQLQPN